MIKNVLMFIYPMLNEVRDLFYQSQELRLTNN